MIRSKRRGVHFREIAYQPRTLDHAFTDGLGSRSHEGLPEWIMGHSHRRLVSVGVRPVKPRTHIGSKEACSASPVWSATRAKSGRHSD